LFNFTYIFKTYAIGVAVDILLLLQYKCKRSSSDPPSVKIEGEQTNDWFAIDLGMLQYVSYQFFYINCLVFLYNKQ